MNRRSADRLGMTPLQALILDRMAEMGWTPAQVESRGVTHATLHRYMKPVVLKQLPRQSVLEQLAGALELPVAAVRRAAWASIEGQHEGHPAPPAIEPGAVEQAIRSDTRLLPEARAHLLAQYQLLLRVAPSQEVTLELLAEVGDEKVEEVKAADRAARAPSRRRTPPVR